ncbi:MAG: hypothetical protein WCH84_02160 [Verrucomicrobiota bacterium]
MARRANFSINPAWVIGVIIVVIGAIEVGYILLSKINNPYRTLTPLNVPAYLENSNSLRGNTYKVTGTVWNSLAWSPTIGRLFSIEVETVSGVTVLPILIPSQFNYVTIEKGQRFVFQIEIDEKGILKTKDLSKV